MSEVNDCRARNAGLQTLAAAARAAGVVGAGGGGFPLADKLLARPYRTLIINAAQSEPLINKDWAALAHYAECVLGGAQLLREALGLKKIFLATRDEFGAALPELPAAARRHQVALARLPDSYPLGYEKILKREVLGQPFGDGGTGTGADDVLVVNAETLRNLSWAVTRKRPLTTKLITLAGAVCRPLCLEVPIGTPFADCLAHAGGAAIANYVIFDGGVLSGHLLAPGTAADACVSATTLGYVLLPPTHTAASAAAGASLDAGLAQRRAAFFASTLAGRTQPMSAAYALFDLAVYRRQRFEYHALKTSAELPQRVHIATAGFAPAVAAGDRVERGQLIASQPGGLARHASVRGVVAALSSLSITVQRSPEEAST